MDLSLKNRVALISGSTQGIGLASAHELALMGATCILLARNETALKEITAQLPQPFQQKHSYYAADFSRREQVQQVIDIITQSNTVHILINNTGGPKAGPVTEAAEEEFLHAFGQHLLVNHLLARACLPGMKKDQYGRIINIISTSVKIPIANLGVSNTTRAAVAGWSKTLSNEVAAFGITVNNILPGFTDTQRLRSLIETNAGRRNISAALIEKEMIESIPAKRFGQATETAAVVAFLASPAAAYVNGVSIPVDGGKTGSLA